MGNGYLRTVMLPYNSPDGDGDQPTSGKLELVGTVVIIVRNVLLKLARLPNGHPFHVLWSPRSGSGSFPPSSWLWVVNIAKPNDSVYEYFQKWYLIGCFLIQPRHKHQAEVAAFALPKSQDKPRSEY